MSHHVTAVGAPRNVPGVSGPLILDRDDEDFIGAVLNELGTAAGRSKLAATRAQARDEQVLKLFQPVQRRFHVALIEAWCEIAGAPRVDPVKVDAAGLVLRRVRRNAQGAEIHEGWMNAAGVLRGWVPVDRLGPERDALGAPSADPQTATRLALRDTGVRQIDRELRALVAHSDAAMLEEQVTPLFVAPPEVCAKAGRTIWYGVVPTASSELAQAEADTETLFEGFGPESSDFTKHLVQPLRGQAWTFPDSQDSETRDFDVSWLKVLLAAPSINEEKFPLGQHRFLQLLRQVAVEFDAFGTSAASRALFAELATIPLSYKLRENETTVRTVDAASFLKNAVGVLFDEEAGTVEMPESWPALSADARARLLRAMSGAMLERFRSVKGRPGRYDETDAQYLLRAFVRLKPEGKCPAKTIWSTPSERFVIAPWYESGGNPVQIAMPPPSLFKSIKPNVSFVLPPQLQGLLMGSPEDLMKGKGNKDSIGVGWICSFSIPVITFCAFIVLNIFLSLFDLIFRWSMFIKICIPYPKAKSP